MQPETIDHAKQSATDVLNNASKRAIQKTTEATGELTGNKIADKIIKVSKITPQNNSETVERETENIRFDRKIPKKRYVSPNDRKIWNYQKIRQKIIDDLRLI